MNTFFLYFILANLGLVAFYLFFRLFLYRDTFFREKRIVLLLGLTFALSYPLVNVSGWLERSDEAVGVAQRLRTAFPDEWLKKNTSMDAELVEVGAVQRVSTQAGLSVVSKNDFGTLDRNMSGFDWVVFVYALVISILLLRLLWQLFRIFDWMRRSKRFEWKGIRLIRLPKGMAPFSFFKAIFVNPETYSDEDIGEIVQHEQAHVRQGHTYDVLFGELICVFLWMNPFAWLLKRCMRENLEFLADQHVLHKSFDPKSYQYHLLQLSCQHSDANLANHFNVSQLKTRIVMMNKKRTSRAGLGKYTLALPLFAALLLTAYACNTGERKNNVSAKDSKMNTSIQGSTSRIEKSDSTNVSEKAYGYNELADEQNRTVFTGSGYNKDNPDVPNIKRPDRSIIRTSLNTKNLFKTWCLDPDGPTASFVFSEKSFYVADYDGNGSMPYELIDKKLKVYYNDFVQEGNIISVSSDSLKIQWKDTKNPTTYSVWKN